MKIIDFEQLSRYHDNLKDVLNTKQDVIDDIDAIRSGADKGTTALQSDSLFIGTLDEYDKIYSEGGIKAGALVIIRDGSETTDDEIGYIGFKVTEKGIIAKDVITPEHTLSSKADLSYVRDNYYNKSEIDSTMGDITTVLESIINGSDAAVNTTLEEIINV